MLPCRPPPYSVQHNGYLARYAATGKATVLDTSRQLVALRKVSAFAGPQ